MADKRFKVTFAPIKTLTYTYEVEVNDPNNAEDVARQDFKMDTESDYVKDFKIVGTKEID
jgi:hypothetical protein